MIHESGEDYLKVILQLQRKNGYTRSVEIARTLGYARPSVSIAMKSLSQQGYVQIGTGKEIALTEKGKALAKKIYGRHEFLSDWLVYLGVDEYTAARDACRIEHYLSPESYEAIQKNALKQVKGIDHERISKKVCKK